MLGSSVLTHFTPLKALCLITRASKVVNQSGHPVQEAAASDVRVRVRIRDDNGDDGNDGGHDEGGGGGGGRHRRPLGERRSSSSKQRRHPSTPENLKLPLCLLVSLPGFISDAADHFSSSSYIFFSYLVHPLIERAYGGEGNLVPFCHFRRVSKDTPPEERGAVLSEATFAHN